MAKKLKMIAVDEQNYSILKEKGKTGESFNDVLTGILRRNATYYETR